MDHSETDATRSLLAVLARLEKDDYGVEHDLRSLAEHPLGSALANLATRLRERVGEEDYRRFTIDQAPDGIFWIAEDGGFSYVNEQACARLGYDRAELLRLHVWNIDPDFPKERWPGQWEKVKRAGKVRFETRHRTKDGSIFPVEISANFVRLGEREHHVAFARDISEQKRAEQERASLSAQLLHAQKMESVGRLAGGVAHDFNNLLSVVLSYSSILLSELESEAPGRAELVEIMHAAERAASLTHQLLAFSRQQVLDFKILDLNDVVQNTAKLLGRLAGADVTVQLELAPSLWKIRADRGQLEQVLMNLAVNARDAMPKGGRLTSATQNAHLDEAYVRGHVGASTGPHVMLTVSDTGSGMDEAIQAHVFEPFFTTKEHGKGTGLGLSTVFGIVKQSGGNVWLYSERGKGTTFSLCFPRAAAQPEKRRESSTALRAVVLPGSETILLVEDDEQVRQLACRILRAAGYRVISAGSAEEAVAAWADHSGEIRLLLTDVVLPGMDGPALAERLRETRPELCVAFMSGYARNVIADKGIADAARLIQKPLMPGKLTQAVREALDVD